MFASILGPILSCLGVHFAPYFRGKNDCVFCSGSCLSCFASSDEALGKTGFLDFDFPVLDLSCEIPSVLLVFYAEVGGGC